MLILPPVNRPMFQLAPAVSKTQPAIIFIAFLYAYPEKEIVTRITLRTITGYKCAPYSSSLHALLQNHASSRGSQRETWPNEDFWFVFQASFCWIYHSYCPFVCLSSHARNVSRPQWRICTFGQKSCCDFKNRCEKHHVASWEENKNMGFDLFMIFRNKKEKKKPNFQ